MARRDKQTFYIYPITFAALAAGGSASSTINIQSDADFFCYKTTYFADIAAAAQTDSSRVIPLVTVLITDTASDQQLMQAPVPVPAMFGTGEIPFILPAPHRFRASGTIGIQVTNFDAASAYNLRLMFIGFKMYLKGDLQGG